MTSDATVMSKPASRGKPLATPPRLTTICAQRPVVHVHDAAPGDAADVDLQRVAPVDVVVEHRGQQVVGAGDGVEIAGEMKVHVLHRHDLRIAAAGGAALHAEVRAKRGLADADRRLLADRVQPVAKADRRRGLALARRCRVDRGHQDQLAVLVARQRLDELFGDLGLVMAEGQQVLGRDAQLRRRSPELASSWLCGRFRCRT